MMWWHVEIYNHINKLVPKVEKQFKKISMVNSLIVHAVGT